MDNRAVASGFRLISSLGRPVAEGLAIFLSDTNVLSRKKEKGCLMLYDPVSTAQATPHRRRPRPVTKARTHVGT